MSKTPILTPTGESIMKRSSNKRTQALKSILETKESEANPPDSLETISEDLIENVADLKPLDSNVRTVTFGSERADSIPAHPTRLAQSIEIFHHLIDKELTKAANLLGIDESELKAWVDLQIEVPAKTILNLLRTMQSLHLDPLNEEIGFTQFEDGQWQALITIEGCSRLLNQHSQFNGLTFKQSDTLIDGVPEWMECSIYRKDRVLPTTVREYLNEVRGETAIWQKMPRRMLRHRVLQQCVRLAL
jgi:hypothetical protein